MIDFTMPALGADMDEGTLDQWLVKPGDTVKRGQVVAVVETTKAAVEVECWHDGVVHELLVPVGETVQVGARLATLLGAGEKAPTARRRKPSESHAAQPKTTTQQSSAQPRPGPQPTGHRRWVSPAARRLASRLGVDVESVAGTGPQGAVTTSDVEHAAAAAPSTPKAGAGARSSAMRMSIAAAMSRSKREIPHYYLCDEIPLDNALQWLSDRNAHRPITERVLPAALYIKAVGLAAQKFNDLNGFWHDDGFTAAAGVHVGVVISLRGGGLVAPAIHDVPDKKLDDLMGELTDLVARARAGTMRSSEMSDPTITLTNLGDQGVDSVFGVIYPPQVALIGMGRPKPRVTVIDGGIRVATTSIATLSADHRASDGHRGAQFLAAVNETLQRPESLEA